MTDTPDEFERPHALPQAGWDYSSVADVEEQVDDAIAGRVMPQRPAYQEPVTDQAAGDRNFDRVFGPGAAARRAALRATAALEQLETAFKAMTDDQRLAWRSAHFDCCHYCGSLAGFSCTCMRDD